MFPASHFRFDYASRTIRIPVWAGKINFILGTEPASYNFSENGIYEIHFSTDWNSVTNANLVSLLNSKFAYLDPTPDIAVTNFTISKPVIGQGYLDSVSVIVENQGLVNEAFNVTVYANATAIFQQPVGLSAGTKCTVKFDWNTTKFTYGDYIIIADVEPLPKETDTSDNNFNASVHVGVPGDISGPVPGVHDGRCDLRDINYLIMHFNTNSRFLNWNPNCDIDGSGGVDMRDICIALLNFNKRE